MVIDYHMHLELDEHYDDCRFNVERVTLYAQWAQRNKVDEIGISEHCNRFDAFQPYMQHLVEGQGIHPIQQTWLARSFRENLDEYVEAIEAAKKLGFPVKTALEVDYLPGEDDAIRALLSSYPFDYLIGSVHFLGTWGIDLSPEIGWPEKDVDDAYTAYFDEMCKAARSGLYDIIAHPDLIKKFDHQPTMPLDELYDALALAAKEGGVAAEISSAGLHKTVGEIYPHRQLLERFYDRGVPITFASDAHEPDHIGRDFDQVMALARDVGYRTITRFDRRQPTQVPFD